MALWKEQTPGTSQTTPPPKDPPPREPEKAAAIPLNTPINPVGTSSPEVRRSRPEVKESVIAADLSIEGKIEGAGHVRIAGRFKGDVHVEGNLTIEQGAHLTGQVKAKTVIVAGELHGNIDGAARVELADTGVIAGDVKAGSFTVAAGSRMRGNVEFGWEDKLKNFATN
jgi:cytoskeletal protein CcmA (bactofilin family)